jgi:ferredoxin-NADP reductase
MASVLARLFDPQRPGALVQALHPLWGTRLPGGRLQGRIVEVVPAGAGAAAVRIRPGHGWRPHLPGQHLRLGVDVDGVRHRRSFTITSLPDPADGLLEVVVKARGSGTVSPHLVDGARPGDVVQLDAAQGAFVLPARPRGPMLFVSGGSGITPFLAMLRALAGEAPRRRSRLRSEPVDDIVLVHHVPREPDCIAGAELGALADALGGLRVELVETRDARGATRPGSRLDAAALDAACPDWRRRRAWACGPSTLVEAARDTWDSAGLGHRLLVEAFVPPPDAAAAVRGSGMSPVSTVTFARSGVVATASAGTPLLEVAESAGLAPAHGCRAGVCHTCSTSLAAGAVIDLVDGRCLGPGDRFRPCVSAAATAEVGVEL